MTCDEFRSRWGDRDAVGGPVTSEEADLGQHRARCSDCARWVARSEALDLVLGAALVVAPPPDLAARLRQLPSLARPSVPGYLAAGAPWETHVLGGALELAALLLIAIAAFTLTGNAVISVWEAGWRLVGDVVGALAIVAASPIVPYLQSAALTALEAMATLALAVMVLERRRRQFFDA